MRAGISQAEADSTVSTLVKWASWLAEMITALRNFLVTLGIMEA